MIILAGRLPPALMLTRFCKQIHFMTRLTFGTVIDWCEQHTHKYSTYRVAQHAHISSRVAQELEGSGLHIFESQNNCHPRVMSHSYDTDHKHKFSLTYLTYLSDSLTNTHKIFGTRSIFTLRWSMAEWRINISPISHRLYEPKSIETKSTETEAIEPEDPRAQKN